MALRSNSRLVTSEGSVKPSRNETASSPANGRPLTFRFDSELHQAFEKMVAGPELFKRII